MTKKEMDLLEKVFAAEIEGRLYQCKNKTAEKLEDDEEVKVFKKNAYYKLGDQVDYVYNAETLMNANLTYWCQVGQEWA